jgi:hypothetical protein
VTENPPQVAASPSQTCLQCSKPLDEGWEFCPSCGTKIVPLSTPSAIDAYVQTKINSELSNRLKDQTSFVREIGDRAEEVVWKRLKQYGVLFGILLAGVLGFIAFLGIKTLDDVSKRIEPVVSEAERRAQAVRRTSEETATQINAVKASLDALSRDVEVQTRRVAKKGGEISQKFERLDATATTAQKRVEIYQARADEVSRNLDAMVKGLESRVAQVSKQVDDVAIRQGYPTIGQQKFVVFNGQSWKGSTQKGVNEKWVNISIYLNTLPDVDPEKLKTLRKELMKAGYTPLIGSFGFSGPYYAGFNALGSASQTTVFYFQHNAEQMATDVAAMASKTLAIKDVSAKFVEPSALSKDLSFVIEKSGIDLQLFIFNIQK